MKSTSITLPIYYTQVFKTKADKKVLVGMNWYRNAHHNVTNKVKHYYHDLVHKLLAGHHFNRVVISYNVYVSRKNTDGHNIRAVIEKFFLDGMVEGGHITDDSIDFIVGDSSTYNLDKENPRIEIVIQEVPEIVKLTLK